MRFEARNLKPHSETVAAGNLEEGETYFFVEFADEEMLIPIMQTVVFIGRNLEKGEIGVIYFQDLESFQEGIRYESATGKDHAKFMFGSEEQTGHIFEFERALDALLRCSLRRRGTGVNS